MSLGFRHLVWNRARFSGRCWATASLTDGAVPLALDAAAACWCRSPHGLTSVSPASPLRVSCPARVPQLVAAFGHGLSLQGPVVLCAHLCPVLSVSEARAQLSALTTVLLSPPARFPASERCPARRPVPAPGRTEGLHSPLRVSHSSASPTASVGVFCFQATKLCGRNVL